MAFNISDTFIYKRKRKGVRLWMLEIAECVESYIII